MYKKSINSQKLQMNIDVKEFETDNPHNLPLEQLQKAYATLEQKYIKTLTQLNSYKESSITSYQKVHQQLQKCKTHYQQFIKKLQKKYENLLHDQRTKLTKNVEKLKSQYEKQRLNLKQIISSKNETIEKLSQLLNKAEQEKSQIIEENTQNLINIVRSQENCLQSKKYSHTQLMKMYQFLLEENNCLKKQLTKVQINQSPQKTKTKKNNTQIVYTQHSDKIESMYISGQNRSLLSKKDKATSKDHSETLDIDVSAIGSQYISKPTSTYKPKIKQNTKANKASSSALINESSIAIDEEKMKKKQPKKIPKTSQIIKKPK